MFKINTERIETSNIPIPIQRIEYTTQNYWRDRGHLQNTDVFPSELKNIYIELFIDIQEIAKTL